jgi:hypothetical protein
MSYSNKDYLKKLKIMSMIKGRLVEMGKEPSLIEKLLMDEYDLGDEGGISGKMNEMDPDDQKQFEELMNIVLSKIE